MTDKIRCTILGCGGSNGVPEIGCSCVICTSNNPKNYRTRASILIETQNTTILVDTSTDLRQQALHNNIKYVDAVLYTHNHSDHVAGIDDVKLMSRNGQPIPSYMDQQTHDSLQKRFSYIFHQFHPLYPPRLKPIIIAPNEKCNINGVTIQTIPLNHGNISSLGFRFAHLAYCTDLNGIPEQSFKYLEGVEIWILDCMRYHWLPSHAYLELVLNWISRIKPKLTILTHMSHHMDYDELKKILPSNIIPAYDGMIVS